jgi:endonuclease III
MNANKRHEIFRIWREANPHPKSDLEYSSTFELLVAVILSAQATDKGVNAATRKLYPVANTPTAILALGEDGLIRYIATIGLYKAKAKNVIATCKLLLDQHGGQVPGTREALEALPGVGRKTANVVLNIAFGEPTIAVDTHNFRVANRTGIAPGKTVEAVEQKLIKFVPDEFKQHAHHWLILHGRYTCKAQTPDCPNCQIAHLCEYKPKTVAKETRKETKVRATKLAAAKPIASRATTSKAATSKAAKPNAATPNTAKAKTATPSAATPAKAMAKHKHPAAKDPSAKRGTRHV